MFSVTSCVNGWMAVIFQSAAPGGIGGSSFPSRVWKNQHFPGHMGNEKVTAKNLKVVKVDTDENLLLVRGSVPGPSGTYIFIRKAKNAK